VLDAAFASRDEALLAVAHGGALGTVRATVRPVRGVDLRAPTATCATVRTGEAVELRDAAVPPRATAPL
jgi:hypothetical protein